MGNVPRIGRLGRDFARYVRKTTAISRVIHRLNGMEGLRALYAGESLSGFPPQFKGK